LASRSRDSDQLKSAGVFLALFCFGRRTHHIHRLIVAATGDVVENTMVQDPNSFACQASGRVVIDDHWRLPGRFFGRFTTSSLARVN